MNYFQKVKKMVWFRTKYGIKKSDGSFIIPPKYEDVSIISSPYKEVYFRVRNNNKFGLINTKGDWIIETISEFPIVFNQNGESTVEVNGKWGVINFEGKWILHPEYESLGTVTQIEDSMGFIRAGLNKNYGYIDRKGEWLINPSFEDVKDFEDLHGNTYITCPAKQYNKWGFINRTGEWIINPKYDEMSHFDDQGFALVRMQNKYGIINREGKEIFEATFDNINRQKQRVRDKDVMYYIDSNIFNSENFTTAKLNGENVTLYNNGVQNRLKQIDI